ncbi:hypothetical protein VTN77DRAFT_7148 [Rasamsonia byssochlamydoides]|uniref:uncharacterized protein n=1 Tax=Rasamsonia byssochlamydoides TaxID=89139 RepID=UPI0037444D73
MIVQADSRLQHGSSRTRSGCVTCKKSVGKRSGSNNHSSDLAASRAIKLDHDVDTVSKVVGPVAMQKALAFVYYDPDPILTSTQDWRETRSLAFSEHAWSRSSLACSVLNSGQESRAGGDQRERHSHALVAVSALYEDYTTCLDRVMMLEFALKQYNHAIRHILKFDYSDTIKAGDVVSRSFSRSSALSGFHDPFVWRSQTIDRAGNRPRC